VVLSGSRMLVRYPRSFLFLEAAWIDDFEAGQAISHPRPVPVRHSRPSARVPHLIRARSRLPNVALGLL
jgi:hypothetical protein